MNFFINFSPLQDAFWCGNPSSLYCGLSSRYSVITSKNLSAAPQIIIRTIN